MDLTLRDIQGSWSAEFQVKCLALGGCSVIKRSADTKMRQICYWSTGAFEAIFGPNKILRESRPASRPEAEGWIDLQVVGISYRKRRWKRSKSTTQARTRSRARGKGCSVVSRNE
ncbi:hypothetical protein ACJ73_04915 [Blastomyces percursus]|uniref:Uncharacterized protein n=1 Tax=Blastomyces percursus TaxID=1658174 RepID=A0A1J9Q5C8_9EURO|nr:hypothetical protein ACJ73_04915 [Blastomyces percursus]